MFYKGPKDRVTRALRRLWEIEVYDGDPDDPKTKTVKHTVIAWNAVDANRRAGAMNLVKPAKALSYVTWDDEPFEIESPKKGPSKKKVKPSIETTEFSHEG